MQRKEIDRQQFENIKTELTGIVDLSASNVTVIEGLHKDYGQTTLIRQDRRFFVDTENATLIRAK